MRGAVAALRECPVAGRGFGDAAEAGRRRPGGVDSRPRGGAGASAPALATAGAGRGGAGSGGGERARPPAPRGVPGEFTAGARSGPPTGGGEDGKEGGGRARGAAGMCCWGRARARGGRGGARPGNRRVEEVASAGPRRAGSLLFSSPQSSSTPLPVLTCVEKGVLGVGDNSKGNACVWFLRSFPHPRPGHAPRCTCLQSLPGWGRPASVLASQVCLHKRVCTYDLCACRYPCALLLICGSWRLPR